MTEPTRAEIEKLIDELVLSYDDADCDADGGWIRLFNAIQQARLTCQALLSRAEAAEARVEQFYLAVNADAEGAMLRGEPVTGAHHRALERQIAAFRATVRERDGR